MSQDMVQEALRRLRLLRLIKTSRGRAGSSVRIAKQRRVEAWISVNSLQLSASLAPRGTSDLSSDLLGGTDVDRIVVPRATIAEALGLDAKEKAAHRRYLVKDIETNDVIFVADSWTPWEPIAMHGPHLANSAEPGDVAKYYLDKGSELEASVKVPTSRLATDEEADLLDIGYDEVVLETDRHMREAHGRLVELTHLVWDPMQADFPFVLLGHEALRRQHGSNRPRSLGGRPR